MRRAFQLASRARPRVSRGLERRISTHVDLDPVEITTLPNKLRVVTEATPGHFSSLGLYIDVGSRYENSRTSGVSHVLDRMAFKSTKNRDALDMSNVVQSLGGQVLCSSSRETMMYQSSHFHSATPLALSLIADTVRHPLFLADEVDAQRDAAAYELREITLKPEMILPEILHHIAYKDNTLGNPLLCPEERFPYINSTLLMEYINTWFRPDRMVIAGAGMPHAELVRLTEEHFGDLQPPKNHEITIESARYTGGHRFIHRPEEQFNHVYVAFEGVPIHDDDVYTLATIQLLLGGGGSFSAGGPGKGMYSRLYTHVLNHNAAIDHCSSLHHIYSDSSLFGIVGSAFPTLPVKDLLSTIVHQLSLLIYSPVPQSELSRAKNQLMSSLVMALESRAVEVEDLGRQILVHGRKVSVQEMCNKIEAVTPSDVVRVAERLFGPGGRGAPTILVMGREDIPDWERVLTHYGVSSRRS